MQPLILDAITRLNIVLSSVTVLIAFSLLAYLFVYNFRNAVARSFVAVLAFVTIVYVGDVFLSTARLPATDPAAGYWLGFQWLGIAFVAPAFLHFSDALLATTGDRSGRRRAFLLLAYLLGVFVLFASLLDSSIVDGVRGEPGSLHFAPGPAFPLFALGYVSLTLWGGWNVWRARGRTLTGRSHRRMTTLMVSIIAPVSAFPWLVLGDGTLAGNAILFRPLIALSNVATGFMLLVVAYAVAYQGALTPERAVKREFIKYLIQAPLLGGFVLATIQLAPERLQESLGLPRDVLIMLMSVFGIVTYQLVVRAIKPIVDQLIYGAVGRDAMWLRRLDERLLTSEDLEHLLENILAAMCDQLRINSGCIVVFSDGRPRVDVFTGNPEHTTQLLAALTGPTLTALTEDETFGTVEGFLVHALRPPSGGAALGLLAVEDPGRPLEPAEDSAFRSLIASAEMGLEDRIIQQRVLDALRALEPELEGLQRLRGALEQTGGTSLRKIETGLVDEPEFASMVKDALSHYWGGPKLTESPLLRLQVVRDALERSDQNPAKAMREVLDEALEGLKPEGARSLTASQWVLYNILELKFVRGLKVRDIAERLAMSESDLYRKQRVAIEALAGQLAAMETQPELLPSGLKEDRVINGADAVDPELDA